VQSRAGGGEHSKPNNTPKTLKLVLENRELVGAQTVSLQTGAVLSEETHASGLRPLTSKA